MEIRLICMDLDGTALQNDHNTFTPRLLAALEEAHRRGIAIAPVTGRQFTVLPSPLQNHPVWEGLAVVCNGAKVCRLSTGEVLYRRDIPEEGLRGVLKVAEQFDFPVEFSIDGWLHLTPESLEKQQGDPNLTFHRDTVLVDHGRIVESLVPLCGQKVEKINLLQVPDTMRQAVDQALSGLPVSAVWSSGHGMEITHPEATKGQGIQALCRLLDIPMESVMALGDGGNDETMLREAGLGVAMGNATPGAKAAADVVTESNTDDGAAIAIETYALT